MVIMNPFCCCSLLAVIVVAIVPKVDADYSSTCSSQEYNTLRLYNVHNNNNNTGEGAVQICLSGTWYAVCSHNWDCREANVACRQLGYDKAKQYVTYNVVGTFGYWSHTQYKYFNCYGGESSLSSCSTYYYSYCHYTSRNVGVRCISLFDSSCSHNGRLRLTGGIVDSEGVLEYCYNHKWTPFCSLDDEEAAVACKQMGYTKYAGFLSDDEYDWDLLVGSAISSISCSYTATESSFSQCTISYVSTSNSNCATSTGYCQNPVAIKCHASTECTDGDIRLVDGSISQSGRVEVCVDGVWGGICASTWTKQAAYFVCKQLGYVNIEPIIFTHGEFGNGMVPLVYNDINCNGWETSITDCPKTTYLHFTCSPYNAAGVLCPDDCSNNDIRLTGGASSSEGTVEVCVNRVWGLISEAGWDTNDAMVVCRQLDLPFDGAYAVYDSFYGKPDRAIYYSYVLCNGDESGVSLCSKITHTLSEGRKIYQEAVVAGVVCQHSTPAPPTPPCVPLPVKQVYECDNGELRVDEDSGLLEYCIDGEWSLLCQLTHNETTVACRQLGYTSYTWGLPYSISEDLVSSGADVTLVSSIKCTSSEPSLKECVVVKQMECMKYCETLLGLRCYRSNNCVEGSLRLADGVIDQEGRVEVCLNGVWSSICDSGWDKTDAHIVCQQLGFSSMEPLSFGGDHFGPSKGPIVYSNVNCRGWEESIEECAKTSHLDVVCSHDTVAGVMCSDDCSDGDVRLVGGVYPNMGTVEVCYGNLWGLINEDGWGLADANVICHQLGYDKSNTSTIGSSFGHPNKLIHVTDVECVGSETTINDCSMKRYSITTGRNLSSSNSVRIAGAICDGVPPAQPVSSSSDHDPLVIVLIALVCVVLIVILLISLIYVIYKAKRRSKQRKGRLQLLPSVTYSHGINDNQYDSVTEDSLTSSGEFNDTQKLVDKEKEDKAKDITAPVTFKGTDSDDHVYEIPSGVPTRTNT